MEKALDNKGGFFERESTRRVLFWLILAIGVFARVYRYAAVPGGINQDEAFAGYEAWAILNYGVDTAGYRNPVYLTAWGSGMNALESYLMMPFIALFGLNIWTVRLPQLIVACVSIPVTYLLVARTVDRRAGLMAMLMIAICPWHIIMSRWGLESNLAPGFLLFGLYFFVRALEDERMLALSALMYGLSLYTYATIWPYVPVMLLVQLIYCMAYKKLRFSRHVVFFALILFAMALPLLLFLMVNYGLIDEIRTPFFSIPRLLYMRTGEISLDEKAKKLKLIWEIFILQSDNNLWNSPEKYGLFYYISLPFALLGFIYCVRALVNALRRHCFCPAALLLVQFVVSLPICLLIKANATKINILFIPHVIFIALGAYFFSTLTCRQVLAGIACVYTALFIGFETYYFTDYDAKLRPFFSYGLDQALELAMEKGDTVYLSENEFYPKVLFYAQTPVDVFSETVEYLAYPAPYLHAVSFERFRFWINPYDPESGAAYVIPQGSDTGLLAEAGFTFEQRGCYTVAYMEGEK